MSTTRSRRYPRVRRSSNGMPMTPEEFDTIPPENWDDHYSYELIRGVLIVCPAVNPSERGPNEELGYLLRSHKENHPQGHALDATLPEEFIPTQSSRRRADRVIWVGLGRLPGESDLPSIVVEFVSKQRRDWLRDYVEKRAEYLALGIVEYWIIDRFRRTMTVYRKPPNEPAEQIVDASGTYQTPLLPGFELPLARLLTVADDWARGR